MYRDAQKNSNALHAMRKTYFYSNKCCLRLLEMKKKIFFECPNKCFDQNTPFKFAFSDTFVSIAWNFCSYLSNYFAQFFNKFNLGGCLFDNEGPITWMLHNFMLKSLYAKFVY